MAVKLCDNKLSAQQPHHKRQQGREDQAGHQRKLETEVVAFDMDVARQAAEPGGEAGCEGDNQANGNQYQSHDYQRSAESVHAYFSRGW